MTGMDILARFRKVTDELEADIEAEETAAPETEPAAEPEPETEETPESNGALRFEIDKVGVSRGGRIKVGLKAGENGSEVLVLVFAPSQGELEEVFDSLGVAY